jgi:hypothetical protein
VGATAFAVGAPGISNDRGSVFVYRNNALEATLTASDAADGDRFGAVLPPTFSYTGALLVGAPSDDAGATANAGSVYSFVRAAGPPVVWSQEAKVTHGSPVANGAFGTSLAVISDTQFLTGEPGRTNGAVHRLARAGGALTLAGSLVAADGQANDGFGTCVAFQDDGTADHVVVGARGVMLTRGALYRYTLSAAFAFTAVERFVGAVGGDAAGSACALPYRNGAAPEVALYGAPLHDGDAFDAGIVYGENFATDATETALRPDGVASNRFGERVVIDGDTAAVGAPNDDEAASLGGPATNGGAVYVYVRTGTNWTQQAKLMVPVPSVQNLGGSLALEGDTLAFSTRNGTANTVWISRRTGTTWSTPTALTPMGGAVGDAFGASLSLGNGSLAVGAPGVNGAGSDRGAVYVFVDSGSAFTQQALLVAGNPQDLDSLGSAVAIDGNLLVAGAPWRDGGGGAVDIGIAYVFTRSGTTWSQQAVLSGPSSAGSAFGRAVAISGTRVAVAAAAVPLSGVSAGPGSVRTFAQSGTSWPLEHTITLASGVTGDEFGASLALAGDVLAVGAPGREHAGRTDVGVVVPHLLTPTTWTAQAVIAAPTLDDADGDGFGRSVAISAQLLLSGAMLSDVDATDAGSAYVHTMIKGNGDTCGASGECSSGFCVDGVCCASLCGGSAAGDCQACSIAAGGTLNGTCTGLSVAAAPMVTCRAAASAECDIAEVCVAGNTSCPADQLATNGTPCNGAPSGLCDAQDTCTAGTLHGARGGLRHALSRIHGDV